MASEAVRNVGWTWFVFQCFAIDGRDQTPAVRRLLIVLCVVQCASLGVILLSAYVDPGDGQTAMIRNIQPLLQMLFLIGSLIVVHDLFGGAGDTARQVLRWPVSALFVLWATELNYQTIVFLTHQQSAAMIVLRAIVASIICVPVAISFAQSHRTAEFRPARKLVQRSVSVILIAAYLLMMLLIALSIDHWSGDSRRLVQVGALVAASVLVAFSIPSKRVRAWLNELTVRHLFRHRYDYRSEWLRFVDTLSETKRDRRDLYERAILALANMTESIGGALYLTDGSGDMALTARHNFVGGRELPASLAIEEFPKSLFKGDVLDLTSNCGPEIVANDTARSLASTLTSMDAWTIVPLKHFDRVIGMAILAPPPIPRRLDWEDRELLKVAGRQLASYLAEHAAHQSLRETAQFDDFNRRMAFAMHDIKNLSSQMALLVRNAQRHGSDPDFQADMMTTLQNSVRRLNALLSRLGRYGGTPAPQLTSCDLAQCLEAAIANHPERARIDLLVQSRGSARIDVERFIQAVMHLVHNALESGGELTRATIDLRCGEREAVIEIIDNGEGMSPQFIRDGLFRPFVSTKQGGFGIGAFEAREGIRSMGGTLDVKSAPGLGSRLTIRLPLLALVSHDAPLQQAVAA